MRHTLVLSYFSTEEIARYMILADVLARWPKPAGFEVSCLICSVVSGVEEDPELTARFAEIMPTRTYRCQTPVTGYPQRPTAMFWEIMDHVAKTDDGDGGFALWFEADMVPTGPAWLTSLHDEWMRAREPVVMGRLQPHNYVPSIRIVVRRHINGGACYAKSYARAIPAELKQGTFDLMPFRALKASGRYAATELFAFGTLAGLGREMRGSAAVLHGYRQDKPAFYRKWAALVAGENVPDADAPCCDLLTSHLRVTYCPIHSPRTLPVRVVNSVTVWATWPYFVAKRRWRMLSKYLAS